MSHVIKCEGDDNAVLFRKMPLDSYIQDTAIIVPDTLNAIIIKDGIALETLSSGKHKIFSKKSDYFKDAITKDTQIDVIFVSKTAKLNLLWGTKDKFDMRDPITGIPIKLGASGELELQISNPRKAYLELIGQSKEFNMDILKDRLQGRLLAEVQYQIANVMKDKNLSYDRLGEVLLPVGNAVLPHIADMFDKDYGLKVFSFTISRVIISDDDVQAIASAKDAHGALERAKAEKIDKERLDDKNYQRQLDMKRLEREDYAKYLEVCRIVGWPGEKKDTKASVCSNCGVKISADMKFCPVCGTEVKVTKVKCPNCGKMITKDDMFCKHCGAKVRG